MANSLKKSIQVEHEFRILKKNELSPAGIEPGSQTKMIRNMTTVPGRQRICGLNLKNESVIQLLHALQDELK